MEKYIVGGAVRDHYMGMVPKDVDYVVVGSTAEEMVAAGFKPVGADFPVFLDESGTEYALARTERKTGNGYNGFVTDHSPFVTLEEDLMRRDLTINAMAQNIGDLSLVDPYNGLDDLNNKVLRHVSPAFAEDPVRVLRLARFWARFGPDWVVAPETLEFCKEMVHSQELHFLTRERVLKEMEKALGEPHPRLFFILLDLCDALPVVFPELPHVPVLISGSVGGRVSSKMRYALLTEVLTDVSGFEQRLGVSVEWQRYGRMFRKLRSGPSYINKIDLLYYMDAYRQSALWEEMTEELKLFEYGADVIRAYEITRHVNFESLDESEKATLKGPDIAEAIRNKRKMVYEQG
ncbi:tRNA nucleotidyl transferase [Xanthomonas phage Xoo-sp13]|nr:tRNA nucleotidyl transferase [Xanthomonas phage Xoo-sp13]